MKGLIHKNIQIVLFSLLGVLITILLVYLWVTPNVSVEENREMRGYEVVGDVSYQEMENPESPTGKVREFCFLLDDEMEYDTTLVFEFSHQDAEVYLDGEKVYALQIAEELSMIRTPGSNWAMIPLYREDIGKEVRVVLTPIYKNYQNQEIQFLVGSKIAIYTREFIQSIPEMMLSMIDIFMGVTLFGIAIYFSVKKVVGTGFYALAVLAISLGLWNFTQTDFAPFVMPEKTVFIYYVSLTMLMVCVVPLIKFLKSSEKEKTNRMLEGWCILCSVMSIIQLLIQFGGICDLREMLKVTHAMIGISSVILLISGICGWKKAAKDKDEKRRISGIWLVGLGALIDISIYYGKGSSSGLFFVLIAIFCYVLLEGIQLFFDYIRQKQMLEEKETQLTLSRITTMMSQIRSHFVFNILNAISGMCKFDPEKADETVVRFSRYLRNNIDIMEDDKPVPFMTELSHLEDYVVLEQVRFEDKIEFYADIQADEFLIPPLIIQPVVENAIKHGLTQKREGGTVVLRTWEEGGYILISVEDNGVGFEMRELEKNASVGLKNIRYRLEHLVAGTLEIESQIDVGTKVTIRIPKKEVALCASYT